MNKEDGSVVHGLDLDSLYFCIGEQNAGHLESTLYYLIYKNVFVNTQESRKDYKCYFSYGSINLVVLSKQVPTNLY